MNLPLNHPPLPRLQEPTVTEPAKPRISMPAYFHLAIVSVVCFLASQWLGAYVVEGLGIGWAHTPFLWMDTIFGGGIITAGIWWIATAKV